MLKELTNFNQIEKFNLEEVANILRRCHSKAVYFSSKYDCITEVTRHTLSFKDDFFSYYPKYYYMETKDCLVILRDSNESKDLFIEAIYTRVEARKQGNMQNLLLEIAQSIDKKIVVDTDSLFLIHIVKKINKKCRKFIFFRMRIKDSGSTLYKYLFSKTRITKEDFKNQEEYEMNFKKLDLKI